MSSVSAKTKQLSLLGWHFAYVEIYFIQVEARDLKTKCLLVSKIGKMKRDYFERRTRKLSKELFHSFDQQPEGKAIFKSKFCHEFKEIKENNFTIGHLMTADAIHVDPRDVDV